jgi:hypothetical protein
MSEEAVTRSESISGDRARLFCQHLKIARLCNRCREIRAAVLAERERAASVDPYGVSCPFCQEPKTKDCRTLLGNRIVATVHPHRWRAAIRQPDEVSDDAG